MDRVEKRSSRTLSEDYWLQGGVIGAATENGKAGHRKR
jgi:hypothetical protein